MLTDAIGNGDEVKKVIKILNDSGVSVFKVCGYLAKKRAIKELEELYKDQKITFKFINETEDNDTYNKALWRLTPVYHSRIEPIDTEHPYYIYSFVPKIEKDATKNILTCVLKELFGDEFLLNDDALLGGDNVMGCTAECNSFSSLLRRLTPKQLKKHLQIERMQYRFRLDDSKSQLRVMAFCSVDVDVNKFHNNGADCNEFLSRIFCKKFEGDIAPQEILCPHCIDTNLSINLLKKFDRKIKYCADSEGYRVFNLTKYIPFEDI